MAKKDTFDKMYDLYNAIIDIDKIINDNNIKDQNGECKLERVLFCVKDISMKDYSLDHSNAIINHIRTAVVEMYNQVLVELNSDITKPTNVASLNNTKIATAERIGQNPTTLSMNEILNQQILPSKSKEYTEKDKSDFGPNDNNDDVNIPSFLTQFVERNGNFKAPIIGARVIAEEAEIKERRDFMERGIVHAGQTN